MYTISGPSTDGEILTTYKTTTPFMELVIKMLNQFSVHRFNVKSFLFKYVAT